ncbi:MAG: hypothetical protein H6585_02920 [Flavobacteriales bacterium]|nr:hypothetical protein [Flavobacteriales bacterium]MCB9447279.1 hypothetical protein [Flavobacteriales bacterium]
MNRLNRILPYIWMAAWVWVASCASAPQDNEQYEGEETEATAEEYVTEEQAMAMEESEAAEPESVTRAWEAVEAPGSPTAELFIRRGLEKAEDFAGYVNLAADASLDPEIRKQAGIAAHDLFSQGARIKGITLRNGGSDEMTVADFLDSLGSSVDSVRLAWNNPEASDRTEWQGDTVLTGHVTGMLQLTAYQKNQAQVSFLRKATIEVVTRKEMKSFGDETSKTWEVKLGDLRVEAPR